MNYDSSLLSLDFVFISQNDRLFINFLNKIKIETNLEIKIKNKPTVVIYKRKKNLK